MPMRLFHGFYAEEVCKAEPEALFIFGDNFRRYGRGKFAGQAVIRDMPNALGLSVKHEPKRDPSSYLSDQDMGLFIKELHRVHEIVAPHLRAGGRVYWPADGLGTGLAEMPGRAPRLYAKLCEYSSGLFQLKGDLDYVSAIVCGGTKFNDAPAAERGLKKYLGKDLDRGARIEIIQGGAQGADRMAADWATKNNAVQTPMKVNFKKYGYAGIEVLNNDMATRLAARRDQAGTKTMVIGMPGAKGTAHMLQVARERGFDVHEIEGPAETTPKKPATDQQATLDL